jgi:hypothetical protein
VIHTPTRFCQKSGIQPDAIPTKPSVPDSSLLEYERANGTMIPDAEVRASPTFVYIVTVQRIYNHELDETTRIEGVFATHEDANRRVRNHCLENSDCDDPETEIDEFYTEEGLLWYVWKDDTGYGYGAKVLKQGVQKEGEEPTQDWGRHIGEPLPCPESSEGGEDSDDSDDDGSSSIVCIE